MASYKRVQLAEAAVTQARAGLHSIESRLTTAEAETDSIDIEIGSAIESLASTYLPGLTEGVVQSVPEEVAGEVRKFYVSLSSRSTG